MKKIIAVLIGIVTLVAFVAIWLSADNAAEAGPVAGVLQVVAKIDAPTEEEVASCQKLLDGFRETIEEARQESKEAAVEAGVTASGMYMLTDCGDVMKRAREAGMVED